MINIKLHEIIWYLHYLHRPVVEPLPSHRSQWCPNLRTQWTKPPFKRVLVAWWPGHDETKITVGSGMVQHPFPATFGPCTSASCISAKVALAPTAESPQRSPSGAIQFEVPAVEKKWAEWTHTFKMISIATHSKPWLQHPPFLGTKQSAYCRCKYTLTECRASSGEVSGRQKPLSVTSIAEETIEWVTNVIKVIIKPKPVASSHGAGPFHWPSATHDAPLLWHGFSAKVLWMLTQRKVAHAHVLTFCWDGGLDCTLQPIPGQLQNVLGGMPYGLHGKQVLDISSCIVHQSLQARCGKSGGGSVFFLAMPMFRNGLCSMHCLSAHRAAHQHYS